MNKQEDRECSYIIDVGNPCYPYKQDSGDEKHFIDLVKTFKVIGYGRMIQIISSHWYQDLKSTGLGHDASKKVSRFTVGEIRVE